MASPRFSCRDGFALAARMRDKRARSRSRTARLVQVAHDGDAAYARCRDLSDTGMKLDLTTPLDLNDQVAVALSRSVVLCGRVAWVNGSECGITFDGPVDSMALLEAVEPQRAQAGTPATLDLLDGRQSWQDDAPIEQGNEPRRRTSFQPGLTVTVMTGPNCEQRGVLRWAKDNVAALELDYVPADECHRPPRALRPGPGQR